MTYYIGVDLGTTYTAAAVARADKVEVVGLGNRSTAVASVLWVGDQGDVLTGDAAQRRAVTDPSRVGREFKRRIGDTTPLLLGGTPYSAESLSAKLLRWVVEEVVRTEGGAPDGVAVTYPANWGPYKQDLLAQAVRLADLPAATTLTEPQAAAAFYASQQRVEPGGVIAVFDLGGGTFDAAVIRKVDDGRFDVLGEPEGIERLGGIDFDDAVFAYVVSMAQAGFDALDPEDSTALAAVARLREECIEAKEALSADTDVSIPVLLPTMSTEVRLTRAEFENMIRPRLEDAIGAMRRSLATAQVDAKDVQTILLVGGSSRIPLVAQMVSAAFGRPVAVDAHPKNAIAMGAAIAARSAAEGAVVATSAAAVADPGLPAQPEHDTAVLAGVASAGAGAAVAAGAAGAASNEPFPAGGGTGRISVGHTPPPPPPPPRNRGGKSKFATVAPAILGIALVGAGAWYMFGRGSSSDGSPAKHATKQVSQSGGGATVNTGGGTVTAPVAPHPILVTTPFLTAPSTTTPVDSGGSTDCRVVAAAANGLTPNDPGPDFTANCQTMTWDVNGAQQKVVAFFSDDGSTAGPKVEVLTQDSSTSTWTPVLEGDGSSEDFSAATVSAANLTGSTETDPEAVIVFHFTNNTKAISIVQNSSGTAKLIGQTKPAFGASIVINAPQLLMYGHKTASSSLRLNTLKWVASQNEYFGMFTAASSEPTSSL